MIRLVVPWLVVAAVVIVGGFFAGRAFRGEGEPGLRFELNAPAYSPAPAIEGVSRAGFSGFGAAGAAEGAVVVAGRVTTVTSDSLTIRAPSGDTVVRVGSDQRLRRLEESNLDSLQPGDRVVVRLAAGEDAAAVLVLAAP